MEADTVAEIMAKMELGRTESQKNKRIHVSNTKKPMFFYVNLAKKFMQDHSEVELSAVGMAITTVVTIVEILKNNGLAIEKNVWTSTVKLKNEKKGHQIKKAKIEFVLGKTENFEKLMAATSTTPPEDVAADDKKE